MTTPMIDLSDLIEKSTDGDWQCLMISFVAARLMDLEVEGLCGAGFGERGEDRLNFATAIVIGVGRRAPAVSI